MESTATALATRTSLSDFAADELLEVPADLAGVLKVSPSKAAQLAREGVIPCVRVGKAVRVTPQAVREYIASGGSAT